MANYSPVVKKHFRPYLQSLKDDLAARKDKTFFWPSGTQVYCGRQGSGKTISAVYHAMRLKKRYPCMILVSNLVINGLNPVYFSSKSELRRILNTAREGVDGSISPSFDPSTQYIFFSSMAQLSCALVEVNNGFKGVVFLIDEIHTYFNSLDSKNIPMYVFTEISQQRKQRKCIVGTSQLFSRMAKPFREQCDNIIFCSTYFGIFTTQKIYDGELLKIDEDTGKPTTPHRRSGFFFHNRIIRNLYDTYQKVVSGAEQYNQTIVINQQDIKKKNKR